MNLNKKDSGATSRGSRPSFCRTVLFSPHPVSRKHLLHPLPTSRRLSQVTPPRPTGVTAWRVSPQSTWLLPPPPPPPPPPPSLKVQTAQWRLDDFTAFSKTYLRAACYPWLMCLCVNGLLSGCKHNGCSPGHSAVVVLSQSWRLVAQRSVAWFWKMLLGPVSGVRCCHCVTRLIYFPPPLLPPTDTVLALSCGGFVKWTLCPRERAFSVSGTFFLMVILFPLAGVQLLRCVLFAQVTPTHQLPVRGSYW